MKIKNIWKAEITVGGMYTNNGDFLASTIFDIIIEYTGTDGLYIF